MRQIPIAILAAALSWSGCAWTAQQIELAPRVDIRASQFGKGSTVALEVQDDRTSKVLGTKVPVGGGQITTKNSLLEVVQTGIERGLQDQGFRVEGKSLNSPRALTVEIRALDYRTAQGFWAGTVTADAALEGICTHDGVRRVEKMFRGSREDSIQVAQSDYWVQQYVDGALADAMKGLLLDAELLKCLAQ